MAKIQCLVAHLFSMGCTPMLMRFLRANGPILYHSKKFWVGAPIRHILGYMNQDPYRKPLMDPFREPLEEHPQNDQISVWPWFMHPGMCLMGAHTQKNFRAGYNGSIRSENSHRRGVAIYRKKMCQQTLNFGHFEGTPQKAPKGIHKGFSEGTLVIMVHAPQNVPYGCTYAKLF